jgi:hypothetical protein
MRVRTWRVKHGRDGDAGTDRAVAGAVLLAVTIVPLLIGFAGPSVYLTLPGPKGWLYIGVAIFIAIGALSRLFFVNDKRKRLKSSELRSTKRRSKL